ncbi:TonB-dependent receptor [Parahaliea maris]|uniref:TonB-dependent receptor n=1 Tax=Parahaliea maris TaxID=2716870 RepID=A0A5C8ZYT2_9GAMM|nr:TonB-dependent receptor [Parahaliea maris]TXS92772.1 TonB-dependent receptor [Parahaliea maris]
MPSFDSRLLTASSKHIKSIIGTAVLSCVVTPSNAQVQSTRGAAAAILEEVVITARKRKEGMQDAPLSVSAVSAEQIRAMKVRDLTSLAVSMPNVAMDEVGTTKGTANFSIRGLGVNSSIPSIDPTVGVFVDGVYMGLNNGIIFDTFDLESIEVLRGPQGILFGRNVTGGAVLVNTRKPGKEFEATVMAAVDGGGRGGYNGYLKASVGGPVTSALSAKLTAYQNSDEGYFENKQTNRNFGKLDQQMYRPVIVWSPAENLELVLRYEYTKTDGQGPASQSHTNGSGIPGTPIDFSRNSFDFSIDEEGHQETETNFLNAEMNWGVGEQGTITNIFGWRDYKEDAVSDVDAQPVSLFHLAIGTRAEQYSNELRYNDRFLNRGNYTAGIYYFRNDIEYAEGRNLLGALTPDGSPAQTQSGGGLYEVETLGAFTSVDYDLSDTWVLTGGLRYSTEEKSAKIASLNKNVNTPCDVIEGSCLYDFEDKETWSSLSPKIGLTYLVSDDARIYAHWTRGYRSGGYNLRNTARDTVNFGPGPFDQEQVDNYEIGLKTEFEWGRLNGAIFHNNILDMQREVNLSDPASGVVQVIKNTADATITGFELDGIFSLTQSLVVQASIGWLDAEYDEVYFDLNGDGVVNGADRRLNLPRAAEWTYSIGVTHDLDLGDWGYMTSRMNFAYRDDSVVTDNNLGVINAQDILDVGLDFTSNDAHWVFSLYAKNLLDEVKHGGDTQLPEMLGPAALGGTFAPLAKGRIFGAEVTYSF